MEEPGELRCRPGAPGVRVRGGDDGGVSLSGNKFVLAGAKAMMRENLL